MSAAKICAASFGLGLFVWLIPSSIEIAAWTRGGIDRVAILAPLYTLWIALGASAALAAALWWAGGARARDARAHVVAPAGALWLTAVPYAPWLGDRFPLLMLLAGPLRWALAAAVAVAVAVRLGSAMRIRTGAVNTVVDWLALRGARSVFVVSLALFLALGLRSLRIVGLGGDEPHYLVITHSLLVDHDIKIENNHARGDYRAFFPGELKPDYLRRGINGEIYSIHAPGLAVAMLPGYALAGSRGAVATVCVFAAIAAAAIFQAALLIGGPLVAWTTWAAICLSVPFVPHAWALYPEMAGAMVMACALIWGLKEPPAGVATWLGRGALVATLPWLHTKFAVLLAAVALWMVVELRGRIKQTAAFLAPIAASGFAWLGFFYVIYGTIDPQAPYGQHTAQFVRLENVPRSILGLLLDQKFGLFVYSPIYLAAIAGAWLLLRDSRRRTFAWFVVGTTVLYAISSGREYMWWGGSSAPARYLVPIVPLLGVLVAAACARAIQHRRALLVGVLAAVTLAVSFAGIAGADRLLLFSDPHGVSRLFTWLQGSAPLAWAFPTFTDENWSTPLVRALPWVAAAGAACAIAFYGGSRRSRFWTAVAAGTAFLVAGAVLAVPIPAEARLEAATRGRLTLMDRFDPQRLRAFDYATRSKMAPAQWIAAAGVTIALDPTQPVDGYGRLAGPLALAPGAYTASVWFQGSRDLAGDLLLALGNSQMLRRVEGPLPNPTRVVFDVPVAVPSLWVQLTDIKTAQEAVRVEIVPEALVPASERLAVDARAVEMVPGRADAYMEYVDEGTFPEGGVFWTRSTARGRVVVVPAGAREIALTLHVGPNAGTVHLTAGTNEQDVPMHAEETRVVSIPVAADVRYVVLDVQASSDFRPSEVDPSSSDTRRLGVQVRVAVR